MAEQSNFSKLPKKQLLFICLKLIKDDFPVGDPYSKDYEETYSKLDNIGRYFGIPVNDEDVQFFSKLLDINESIFEKIISNDIIKVNDKSLYEQLVIPEAKTYELQYSIWGTCNYTEYMSSKFDAYDMDWVPMSADRQKDDGNWDYYYGTTIKDTEYENFEQSDMSYDNVIEVNKDGALNANNMQESVLSKLVIENTQEVVNSLDRKTLLKLKSFVESRLRLL